MFGGQLFLAGIIGTFERATGELHRRSFGSGNEEVGGEFETEYSIFALGLW
jgi:hypothetical protein